MIPRQIIAIVIASLLMPLTNAQATQGPTIYVPDVWTYVVMNPLTAAFIVVFIVLII